MSIVVEDGTGVAGSNSYVSVSFADGYFGSRLYADSWTSASTPNKEKALMMASDLLDVWVLWDGEKTYPDATLSWPRQNVYTPEGYLLDKNSIPVFLKKAVCELAIAFLSENRLADSDTTGYSSIKVGQIQLDVTQAASSGFSKPVFPRSVTSLIHGYGRFSTTSSIPLVRS